MSGISAIPFLPSATQSATATIRRATAAAAQDAAVVANAPQVASRELIEALIDSRQQVLYTAAATKLINASDQMTRSVIDILA